nr:sigma intracellular receptor 2 isoform X1 [Macaca nemestrina]
MRPAGNTAPCPRASSSRQPMGAACIALERAGRRPRRVGPGRRADLAPLLTSAGPGPTDGRWGFRQPGAAWSGCWASTFSAISPSPCSWTCRRCCRATFTQSRALKYQSDPREKVQVETDLSEGLGPWLVQLGRSQIVTASRSGSSNFQSSRVNCHLFRLALQYWVRVTMISRVKTRNLLKWYAKEFKDPLLQEPPAWFKSFLFCELVFQLPFFPIATYAFLKGSCKWIRTPAIIYSVHTMTTLIPILSTFLFEDFSKASGFKGQRPETLHERLTLISVYAPYLLIPFILLIFMLRSPYYKYEEKRKKK